MNHKVVSISSQETDIFDEAFFFFLGGGLIGFSPDLRTNSVVKSRIG